MKKWYSKYFSDFFMIFIDKPLFLTIIIYMKPKQETQKMLYNFRKAQVSRHKFQVK